MMMTTDAITLTCYSAKRRFAAKHEPTLSHRGRGSAAPTAPRAKHARRVSGYMRGGSEPVPSAAEGHPPRSIGPGRGGYGEPPRQTYLAHQRPGHNAPRRRRRGFTLLELITVLILISLVLALAAPSLRRFARSRETSETASHLLALAHLARSQAVAQARPWRLNVDPEQALYWLTAQEAGAFVQPQADYGRSFRFPDGVAVTVDAPETEDHTLYVQFDPDGRSDEATIELEDLEGRVLQVTSPSVTERFRIVTLTGERAL